MHRKTGSFIWPPAAADDNQYLLVISQFVVVFNFKLSRKTLLGSKCQAIITIFLCLICERDHPLMSKAYTFCKCEVTLTCCSNK